MISLRSGLAALLVICHLAVSCLAASNYKEQLFLRPLHSSALLASFNFKSNTSLASFDQQNFHYFPRSLGQILQHANAKELHLRFGLGRWDTENWGARPWNGAKEGGTGVELWAWVDADSNEQAVSRWQALTNALSGLFCASLNFIDSTRTIRPVLTFAPTGIHPSLENLHLLHGSLPREPVCTENLTPFLKLLPCKGRAGISSLLNGHKLFDASWQSMSIDVRPICQAGGECVLEIEQTVDMVLDIDRSKRPQDNPIPRPKPVEEIVCDSSKPYAGDACYPVGNQGLIPWSLRELFGRPIRGTCPLGDEALTGTPVCVKASANQAVYASDGAVESRLADEDLVCYRLNDGQDFDLVMPQQDNMEVVSLPKPRIYAERTLTGHGQEHGGVQTVLENPSSANIEIVYMETLPWFMKIYLSTLKAKLHSSTQSEEDVIKDIYYRPALDRKRGTQLELRVVVPAHSTVVLSYDFEKAILRYTEYPPDANRGFDVASAVITIFPTAQQPETISMRTTALLLYLPTPDFSMPYNVIILTSTIMALAFGSIFNLLVRRFVAADEVEAGSLKKLLLKLKSVVASLRQKLLRRGPISEQPEKPVKSD